MRRGGYRYPGRRGGKLFPGQQRHLTMQAGKVQRAKLPEAQQHA
jgi:hypothetical protein